ncbi:MAG: RNA pseudouridine synthase [Alphaproteobacteria bacterium]|jgi:tRNA pseudouridine32 synthase/23S rRNA pseudouridine746 synthase|nr:RNA pseudouridine synthase [Alphaproteobacteria bacterium]
MLLSDHVLFLDGEALVIDKPAGLPVDAPRDGSLSVENYLASLTFGFQRWPLPVHRLDRDTSGCLLLARNPKAHKKFAAAFEAGEVEKTYLAVLDGIPAAPSGVIDMALGKTSTAQSGWRMVADPKGKAAITNWDIVATYEGRALVRFCPKTGRTHQLRVHAATGLGLPISGDPVYGAGKGPMLLHAHSLRLPRGAKPPIVAEAPLPASFATAGFAALPPQNG